jgi:hypothetical protein
MCRSTWGFAFGFTAGYATFAVARLAGGGQLNVTCPLDKRNRSVEKVTISQSSLGCRPWLPRRAICFDPFPHLRFTLEPCVTRRERKCNFYADKVIVAANGIWHGLERSSISVGSERRIELGTGARLLARY